MHLLRLFQFKYWFYGDNPVLIFGKMRQVEQEAAVLLHGTSKLTSRKLENGQCHKDAGSVSAQSKLFFDDN